MNKRIAVLPLFFVSFEENQIMDTADKMLLIRDCNIFRLLSQEEIDELKVLHGFIEARRNDYIYFEAQYHNRIYFIKKGFIKIGYISNDGREVAKEIISKGDFFGQFTLEKNHMHGEFAKAYKDDVSLCAFKIEDFEKILSRKPSLAITYSKFVAARLRNFENRFINILHKDIKTRLLGFIVQLIPPDSLQSHTVEIENHLTHDDIGHLVGSSRQTITTVFKELETNSVLSYKRNKITIKNLPYILTHIE